MSWKSASLKRAWREVTKISTAILRAMSLDPDKHINKSNHEVRIPGLGEIWFRTADNPSSLAGEGIDGAVLDEFSLMQEVVWTEYIQGTLIDKGGWVAFAGVPKGYNWATYIWQNAAWKEGWLQVKATSYDNPFNKKEKIDEIKNDPNTSERMFRQEYLAEILSDGGGVFRNVQNCAIATPQSEAIPGHDYIVSVDTARVNDFNVITVIDTTLKEVVYIDRFNMVDTMIQVNRITGVWERFGRGALVIEQNSAHAILDLLQQRGIYAIGFQTTNASKTAAIQALERAFDYGEIKILNDPVLIGELMSFDSEKLPSGLIRYSAPAGMHDDCAISLAIGWHHSSQFAPLWIS